MDGRYLLVRSVDHVVLGVQFTQMELVAPGGLSPPSLRAAGPTSSLVLTFPPQHITEQVIGPGLSADSGVFDEPFDPLGCRLAGISRVAFEVSIGTPIPLTVEGILSAVDAGLVLPGRPADPAIPGDTAGPTAIEMPWRLVMSPEPRSGRGFVTTSHSAGRLDLSSLGGNLTVRADWTNLRWQHDATLGRDRRVHIAAEGVLYPLGHRARFIQLTERVCVEGTTPIMALQKHQTLVLTETTRPSTPDDATLARSFPFAEVEIMESAVSLAEPVVMSLKQEAPETSELLALRKAKEVELEAAILPALVAMEGPGTTLESIGPDTFEGVLHHHGFVDSTTPDLPPEVFSYFLIHETIQFIDDLIRHVPLESVSLFFTPTATDGSTHRFPVRLAGAMGDVHIELPLLFVFDERLSDPMGVLPDLHTLTDPRALATLDQAYADARAGQVETYGVAIDLIGSAIPAESDVQEVHRLNLVGTGHEGGFLPRLGPASNVVTAAEQWAFEAAMPAVRSLLGATPPNTLMRFSEDYLRDGEAADVVFRTLGSDRIGLDFVGRANLSGGLIAPRLAADAISRAHGLVQSAGLGAPTLDPAKVLGEASTLLGFKLSELVDRAALRVPPGVTARLDGVTPEVRMEWKDVTLQDAAPFVARGAKLDLSVVTRGTESTTTCTVTNFKLALPSDPHTVLEVGFDSLRFTQLAGQPPKLEVGTAKVTFMGRLRLVEELQNHVALGDSAPRIQVDDTRIVAQYLLPIPSAPCGVFVMRNIAFRAVVDVPFDGDPVSVTLAFASRANPFNLSVLMFGGGGYLELEVNHRGLQRLEASLEFGASVAINFIVASGEVHAMGGVRFVLEDGQVQLTGFLRFGGSVEVLGIISVSAELLVTLSYDTVSNEMYGQATLVVDIDLLLYSDSVELDTGKWVLAGGSAPRPVEEILWVSVPSGRVRDGRPRLRVVIVPRLQEPLATVGMADWPKVVEKAKLSVEVVTGASIREIEHRLVGYGRPDVGAHRKAAQDVRDVRPGPVHPGAGRGRGGGQRAGHLERTRGADGAAAPPTASRRTARLPPGGRVAPRPPDRAASTRSDPRPGAVVRACGRGRGAATVLAR